MLKAFQTVTHHPLINMHMCPTRLTKMMQSLTVITTLEAMIKSGYINLSSVKVLTGSDGRKTESGGFRLANCRWQRRG